MDTLQKPDVLGQKFERLYSAVSAIEGKFNPVLAAGAGSANLPNTGISDAPLFMELDNLADRLEGILARLVL